MRIFDRKCCFKHTYKNRASLLPEEDQKSRREEENMLVPALGQEETLLSALIRIRHEPIFSLLPNSKVKESLLSIRRRRLRHSHEAGYV
jgi:hypothetical protein